MSSAIVPHIANVITSRKLQKIKRSLNKKNRLRTKSSHVVTVYLRLSDAYSYVLLQVLEELQGRYPIEYEFRTIMKLQPEMYPAPPLWESNAFNDGLYLKKLYGLKFPSLPPESTPERGTQLTARANGSKMTNLIINKALHASRLAS
jgi:hypothetical protein